MKGFSLAEFRPTINFLLRFVGIYIIGNLLYGWYVTEYYPRPDPATRWVTIQTAHIVSACGFPVTAIDHNYKPITRMLLGNQSVLDVYEGCNGLNTMIIFTAFVVAFGPNRKERWWFLVVGIFIIHLVNLARIALLFFVAEYKPEAMYVVHKYVFTAVIYVVIFILWIWWVRIVPRNT